jgi:two-component system, chemotaxis family, chemotaxis protein CheY
LMPEMDGQTVLKEIRRIESETGIHGSDGIKIIMTSALSDRKNILDAFKSQCEAYLVKPVDRELLLEHLREFKLLK